jgi:hypothetical protein
LLSDQAIPCPRQRLEANHLLSDFALGISSHCKTDPAFHRVAEVVGSGNVEIIQDSGDVGDIALRFVGVGLMRLVACPMATSVNQDEPVLRLQPVDISGLVPRLQAVGEPVLNQQGLPITLNSIMKCGRLG